MAFCSNCGHQLADGAKFCFECGAKVAEPTVPQNEAHKNVYDDSGTKRNYLPTNFSSDGTQTTYTKPRKGLKICAIVCFVLAAIYGLIGLISSMIFGFAAFFVVLGIMFIVLCKSPKHIPYILGMSSGIKKPIFVIISVIAAYFVCGVFMATSDDLISEIDSESSIAQATVATGEVTSIADFKTTEYDLLVGEFVEFSVELQPKDLTADSVGVEIQNADIISVSDVNLATEGRKTVLTFKCSATAEGETTMVIKSNDGDLTSNVVTFKVETPPLVTHIGKFSPSYAVQEVGDQRTVTVYMKPTNLTQDDFIIENSDESIIRVSDVAVTNEDDTTVLTFTVTGAGVGNATITIKGADGKTESNTLQFTINEKDTSRTVYVTPYGEKYHYSAACAGSNATETTENKAINSGRDRCKKCG